MKKLGIAILLIISALTTKAGNHLPTDKKDTTVVEFTDKGTKKRLSVMTNGKKDFQIPSTLNLDNLLREIGVDSSERKKAIVLVSQNGEKQDTILVISRDGRKIKIVTNEPKGIYRGNSSNNDTLRHDEPIAQPRENSNDNDNDDNHYQKHDRSKEHFFSRTDFSLYLGLNNWYSTKSSIAAPELSPLGSRYVALSWRRNIRLATGKNAELALSYAPEVLWYNFMFDGNKYININPTTNQVQFTENSEKLTTSKLVVPTLNLPVMLNVGFKESRFVFGVGGYIGYNIDTYTKLKYEKNGDKDHTHANYNMNSVRYGVTAEIGRKNGLKLFFRYDLSPLFKSDQINASSLQGWSVGLKLL